MSQATRENIKLSGFLRIKLIKLDLVHFKIMHNKRITSQQNFENSNNIIPNPFCVINLIDRRQQVYQLNIKTFQVADAEHVQQFEHGRKNRQGAKNISRYIMKKKNKPIFNIILKDLIN
jgi:hypothetical protein